MRDTTVQKYLFALILFLSSISEQVQSNLLNIDDRPIEKHHHERPTEENNDIKLKIIQLIEIRLVHFAIQETESLTNIYSGFKAQSSDLHLAVKGLETLNNAAAANIDKIGPVKLTFFSQKQKEKSGMSKICEIYEDEVDDVLRNFALRTRPPKSKLFLLKKENAWSIPVIPNHCLNL
ncbi:unnamed protein product [Ceutorhynchus assimilis]|uniref:Uncharacterized protein n=1 Tax=Ceutorhynchus assimilis TaxID=467358 RepID=A0A9N9QQQ3_9CUCU|nr:unnamed protein product [Ceutorhynchus assimilis]